MHYYDGPHLFLTLALMNGLCSAWLVEAYSCCLAWCSFARWPVGHFRFSASFFFLLVFSIVPRCPVMFMCTVLPRRCCSVCGSIALLACCPHYCSHLALCYWVFPASQEGFFTSVYCRCGFCRSLLFFGSVLACSHPRTVLWSRIALEC